MTEEAEKQEVDTTAVEAAHESLKWLGALIINNVPLVEQGRQEVFARIQAVMTALPALPEPKPNRQTRRTTAKGTKPAPKARTTRKR